MIKIIKLFACVVLLFILSCTNSSDKLPIPEEKLIPILLDIHKAEAMLNSETQPVKDSMSKRYYGQIFTKHGISRMDYDTILSYLSFRPLEMNRLYDKVIKQYQEEGRKLSK